MPLNEASAPRSNLTARQRREALAAIYGVPQPPDPLELAQIRRLLQQDDADEPE